MLGGRFATGNAAAVAALLGHFFVRAPQLGLIFFLFGWASKPSGTASALVASFWPPANYIIKSMHGLLLLQFTHVHN